MRRNRQLAATTISVGVLCLGALPASAATQSQTTYSPAPSCLEKVATGTNTYTEVYNNCGGPSYDVSVTYTTGGRSECATIPRGHANDYQPNQVQDVQVCE